MRWNRTLPYLSPVTQDITNIPDPSPDLHTGFPWNMKAQSLCSPRKIKIHFKRFGSESHNRCFDFCGKLNSLWYVSQSSVVENICYRFNWVQNKYSFPPCPPPFLALSHPANMHEQTHRHTERHTEHLLLLH